MVNTSSDTKDDKYYFAFSSIRSPLLHQILLNDTSAPKGYISLYRYEKSLVHPEIWEKVQSKSSEMEGRLALIIYLHDWSDLQAGEPEIFIPLRFAKISQASVKGEHLFLYLELLEYPNYEDPSNLPNKMALEFGKNVISGLNADHRPPKCFFGLGRITGEAFVSTGKHVDQLAAWQNLVKALGVYEPWKSNVHYKIDRLVRTSSRRETELSLTHIIPLHAGYSIDSWEHYRIDINFFHPERVPKSFSSILIKPKLASDKFHVPNEDMRPTFSYDLKSAVVLPKIQRRRSITRLSIEPSIEGNGSNGHKVIAPKLNFLLELKHDKRKLRL
jgi:hypothetical protein